MKYAQFTFDMNEPTSTDYRLMFGIGGNNTAIRFDDISIIKQGCANQYRLDNSFSFHQSSSFQNFFIKFLNLRQPFEQNYAITVYKHYE